MRRLAGYIAVICLMSAMSISWDTKALATVNDSPEEYTVGISDMLRISVLRPEVLESTVTVAPDGFISFPYIGGVYVRGMTLRDIENEIAERLSEGYMNFPVVSVALAESRSRRFFVYGEVNAPGPYPIEENTTVLKAISMAGGFTRFGSSSRVELLRPKKDEPGYKNIKVNINRVMRGDSKEDLLLKSDDVVVVSEGMF